MFCLPIVELVAVNVTQADGTEDELTPTNGGAWLEWQGRRPILVQGPGAGWWPSQNLGRRDGDPSTWSVEVRTGVEPPAHVVLATSALALDILAECDTRACSIPAAATRVARRGVTIERDPEKIGSGGVAWEMLQGIFDVYGPSKNTQGLRASVPVETFATPGGSVLATSWQTVWGPTRIPDDPGPP